MACGGGGGWAQSGLPLGNQFAKADAQQGTNFWDFQQLLSNTYQGTVFLLRESFVCLFIHISGARSEDFGELQ